MCSDFFVILHVQLYKTYWIPWVMDMVHGSDINGSHGSWVNSVHTWSALLRGAKILVTPMGGLGNSNFWMLSRQHFRDFLFHFVRKRMVYFCYVLQCYLCLTVFDTVLKLTKHLCFLALHMKRSFGAKICRNFHLRMGSWPILTWDRFSIGAHSFRENSKSHHYAKIY